MCKQVFAFQVWYTKHRVRMHKGMAETIAVGSSLETVRPLQSVSSDLKMGMRSLGPCDAHPQGVWGCPREVPAGARQGGHRQGAASAEMPLAPHSADRLLTASSSQDMSAKHLCKNPCHRRSRSSASQSDILRQCITGKALSDGS